MPLRIVQTGTYCSANKGDAAMQLACAIAMRHRWPDSEIIISSPFPDLDTPFYRNIAKVVPCHRRRLIFSMFQLLRVCVWRLARKVSDRGAAWLIPDLELQAYRHADLVIDLSGDMLTEDYGVHVSISHYIPLINTLLLGRPLYICAQSIGPFRWTRWLAKYILRRADAITLRDEISFQHLKDIHIKIDDVKLTADMAFMLEPAPADRVDEILKSENIHFENHPVLGVSLSRILEQRYQAAQPEPNKPFTQLIANVLDRFVKENSINVLFVPHVTGPTESKDDRRISMEVASIMKMPAHILQEDYRPEELKGIIGRCALFLGARMHANIAALSEGIPVVALSYSHKAPGIMALLGQQQYLIDGNALTGERLLPMLHAAWSQRINLSAAIYARISEIHKSAGYNLHIMDMLLDTYTDRFRAHSL